MITLPERLHNPMEVYRKLLDQFGADLRVACPGIVESFDATAQTATVNVALREKINIDGNLEWTDIPTLVDVPVLFPRAGGYAITFPVQAGDECLVIFCDLCIDAHWQSGGVQNQIDKRRHDLSDGMAIITGTSQPNRLSNVSNSTFQIRNNEGTALMEISGTTVNILGGTVNIMNRNFMQHTHSGVQPGGGSTGGVV